MNPSHEICESGVESLSGLKQLHGYLGFRGLRGNEPAAVLALLAAATVCAVGHYAFGDWARYPNVALWRERAFWAGMTPALIAPVLLWVVWSTLSLGWLKPARVIFVASLALCLGDLVWLLVWLNLKAVGLDYRRFVGYWDWWEYWLPVVTLVGNLFLARRWWQVFYRSEFSQSLLRPPLRRAVTEDGTAVALSKHVLRGAALFLGSWAALLTAMHLILPRMAVSDLTLSLANIFLAPEEWRADFEFVVENSVSRGKRLGALLDHASLAHLQRGHFYQALDELVYQQFVLSSVVDRLPLSELDWRRTLWENFFPRVRHEHDPVLAAQTVVRYLRERVGIDPSYSYRVGVETIWTQQMTDETGFERIYTAALRSVGIAARLNEGHRAELWTGNAWREAPRPIIASWSTGTTKTPGPSPNQ